MFRPTRYGIQTHDDIRAPSTVVYAPSTSSPLQDRLKIDLSFRLWAISFDRQMMLESPTSTQNNPLFFPRLQITSKEGASSNPRPLIAFDNREIYDEYKRVKSTI